MKLCYENLDNISLCKLNGELRKRHCAYIERWLVLYVVSIIWIININLLTIVV